jgi:hypothetical protein
VLFSFYEFSWLLSLPQSEPAFEQVPSAIVVGTKPAMASPIGFPFIAPVAIFTVNIFAGDGRKTPHKGLWIKLEEITQ